MLTSQSIVAFRPNATDTFLSSLTKLGTGKIASNAFFYLQSESTRTDGNANVKQTGNEGIPKALSAFSSFKRNINVSSNYANNNTPSKNHPDTQLKNKQLLPLEGFPDPPYETNFDNEEVLLNTLMTFHNETDKRYDSRSLLLGMFESWPPLLWP